jgi:hypothetical protein
VQFTGDVETIGKSTIDSGNFREYEAVSIGWTGSAEGQVHVDSGVFTVHDIFDLQKTLAPVFLVWEVDAGAAGTVYYYMSAIITILTQVYNVNDIASFNAEFQGTGEMGRDTEAPIYGNYPELFQISEVSPDTPGPGEVTIDFVWNAADPEPEGYRIDIYDVTADNLYLLDGGGGTNTLQTSLDDTHSYTFKIRSAYFAYTAFSEYSPVILTWP